MKKIYKNERDILILLDIPKIGMNTVYEILREFYQNFHRFFFDTFTCGYG